MKPNGAEIKPGVVYTAKQACQRLGWGQKALSKAVYGGKLPVIQEGRAWRFLGEHLLKLAQPMEGSHAR